MPSVNLIQSKRSNLANRHAIPIPAENGFFNFFQNASIGIYRSSPDGRQCRANPALVRLNGYRTEREQLDAVNDIAQEWYVDPTRRDTFSDLLERHGRVENFVSEVYRHRTRERIWIVENAWTVCAPDGCILYYEGTVEEITERKQNDLFRDMLAQFIEDSLERGLDDTFYGRLLERAVAVVPGAQAGSIILKNELGRYSFVAAVNFDLDGLQQISFTKEELLIELSDASPQRIFDYDENPRLDERRQRILESAGRASEIKVSLSVPITLEGEVTAYLHLNNFEDRDAFGDEAVVLTRAFSRQVAALLRRLNLETELRTKQAELERWATFRSELNHFIVETLAQGFHDNLYQRLLERAVHAIPGTEGGSILLKGEGGNYHFVATHLFDLSALQAVSFSRSELITSVSDTNCLITGDLPELSARLITGERQRILEDAGRLHDIKATLSLPVYIDGELIAVLGCNAFSSTDAFSPEARAMADTFANQIGVVLQRLTLEKELERTNRELAHLASFDALTGLANRSLFTDRLDQALHKAKRDGGSVGLIFLDLDGFKLVNDSLGHGTGDELLQKVGKRLSTCIRAGDTVARLGGDEFTLVLDTLSGPEDAAVVAQKVLDCLSEPFKLQNREMHIGASIGITTYPEDGSSVEALVKHADTAMYHAKSLGKNRYHFFTAQMNERVLEQLQLETDLRRGLDSAEFFLHYQPRVDLATGRVTSTEALARWQHPERGLVSPYTFIPLAERSNLIGRLGAEMLRQACQQAKLWADRGEPMRVAVNISARQLQQDSIVEDIAAVLAETGLPASLLELEITESAAMSDVDDNIAKLSRLRDLGVAISVDDFGTAYSSLNYLKRLPVSSLKIDKSFVQDIGVDSGPASTDAAIVRAIVALGQSLGYTLIAEGVETEQQLAFLRSLGCDEAQGYLFSKPLSPEALAPWLARQQSNSS